MDRFWFLMCLKHHIDLINMIRLFVSGATDSLVAKHGTRKLSQLLEEPKGSNLEFKLITPKTYYWNLFIKQYE